VLTVVPKEGTQVEAVSLEIVVPSRRRVYKVVGPGKDVNLPSFGSGIGNVRAQWKSRIDKGRSRSGVRDDIGFGGNICSPSSPHT
jgi:hypothetical protein